MVFVFIVIIIVFGVMVEWINFKVYMLYFFVSMFFMCFLIYWIWGKKGLFKEFGVIDIVGCLGVYLVGGVVGLVVVVMLGFRLGCFDDNKK